MQLVEETRNVIKSGNFEDSKFEIAANSQAFKILSTKLYSNGIRAIVRELGTNAYDAHTAAKNPEPFLVISPSILDPNFIIEDFGIGLSPENIKNVFTVYFNSDKRESNDFNGCLGLGCKSPLGYCEGFMVESKFDGVKYIYSVHLDEGGFPTMSKITEETSDEKNGVKITIPVKSDDVDKFRSEIRDVYSHFENPPIVDGEQLESIIKEDSHFYINSNRSYVYMGNVLYPFSPESIDEEYNEYRYRSNGVFHGLVLRAELGDIEFPPSREEMTINSKTIKFVKDKIDLIAGELRTNIIDFISKHKSLRGAYIAAIADENISRSFKALKCFEEDTHPFVEIEKRLYLDEMPDGIIDYWNNREDYDWRDSSRRHYMSEHRADEFQIILKDQKFYKGFMKSYADKTNSPILMVETESALKTLKKFLHWNDCEHILLSDIYEKKGGGKTASGTSRVSPSNMNFYELEFQSWGMYKATRCTPHTDLKKTGTKIFYLTDGQLENLSDSKIYNMIRFLNKYCGYDIKSIYSCKSKLSKRLARKSKMFVDFVQFTKEKFQPYENLCIGDTYYCSNDDANWFKFIEERGIDCDLMKKHKKLLSLNKRKGLNVLLNCCYNAVHGSGSLESKEETINLSDKYPLLDSIWCHSSEMKKEKYLSHVLYYIKGVNSNEI